MIFDSYTDILDDVRKMMYAPSMDVWTLMFLVVSGESHI